MKKSWKKASAIFMAAALAGVMTVSMSATAFAADDDGYILKQQLQAKAQQKAK